MADMILTRIEGFTFNNVTVDNTLDEDIILIDVEKNASPNLTYFDFSVPFRHGSRRFDNRYEDRLINVTIGVYAKTAHERRQIERQFLQNIIGKEGRLFFKDEPTLFYVAKVYGEITREESNPYTILTITFIASYCAYEKHHDLRDYTVDGLSGFVVDDLDGILVNRQEWSNVITNQVKQIENYGNFETAPIISLSGTATNIQMQIADVAFSFANLSNEQVFIDSENMIVYKIVNNKKQSVLTRFNGNYPKIPIGQSDVIITGTGLNLNITVDYKNTFIVV
jgi:predicted phage tail component-like protein